SRVRGQPPDGVDAGGDPDLLAVDHDPIGTVDQAAAERSLALVADDHHPRLAAPEVVPQVVQDAAAGAHAAAGDDQGAAAHLVDAHRVLGGGRLSEVRQQFAQAAAVEQGLRLV